MLLALCGAEIVTRLVGVPPKPYQRFFTNAGVEVPLGEVIAYLAKMLECDSRHNLRQQKPHGLLLGSLKMRQGYWPLPSLDYFDADGCVSVDTNSLGLRDLEFAVEKQPGELRILALGDSMTYGLGVRLDLTWVQVLEARLRRERSAPAEVINAGFAAGGHSPASYHTWVKDNGIQFAPDIVIVGLCLNDVDPRIGMLTYPIVPVEPVLGGWSLMLDRIVQAVRQSQARTTRRDFRAAITAETPSWVGTQNGLRELRSALAPRGVELVVVVLPMLSQLEPELYPCRGVHELVRAFCQREHIRCLDLLPEFLGRDEEELWVHASDQHANHIGHAIQAEHIFAYLQREGLLE